jgi:hypothetical protein
LAAPAHRVVRVPVGPKPIGILVKFDFKDWFQRHTYCFLDNLVPQTGDSKPTHFAIGLGNLHLSERSGLIRTAFYLQTQLFELLFAVSLETGNGHSVYARGFASGTLEHAVAGSANPRGIVHQIHQVPCPTVIGVGREQRSPGFSVLPVFA